MAFLADLKAKGAARAAAVGKGGGGGPGRGGLGRAAPGANPFLADPFLAALKGKIGAEEEEPEEAPALDAHVGQGWPEPARTTRAHDAPPTTPTPCRPPRSRSAAAPRTITHRAPHPTHHAQCITHRGLRNAQCAPRGKPAHALPVPAPHVLPHAAILTTTPPLPHQPSSTTP